MEVAVKRRQGITLKCKICADRSLAGRVGKMVQLKMSLRDIAAQVGRSRSMIDRHRRYCLDIALRPRPEPDLSEIPSQVLMQGSTPIGTDGIYHRSVECAEDYWAYMRWLQDHATSMVVQAAQGDNHRMWQLAVKEARENATALAKASGWIRDDEHAGNQILNVFGNVSRETLLALRDALTPKERSPA